MTVPPSLLEQLVDLILGARQDVGLRLLLTRLGALEHLVEELRELIDGLLHLQPDESERRTIVEQDDEDHATGDVREIHRLLLALVKEGIELGLADQAGELVVGAEVRRGERRECRRVEARLLTDGGDELSRSIDEQRAARIAVVEELLERPLYRAEIVLRERPACCTNGHLL